MDQNKIAGQTVYNNTQLRIHSERIQAAISFATIIHASQFRKDNKTPYIAHLIGVAMILSRAQCDEDTVIAGLLHDSLEDKRCFRENIADQFGLKILSIVLEVTEKTDLPWKQRKEEYISRFASGKASEQAVLVSSADLIDNRLDLIRRRAVGEDIWKMFDQSPMDRLNYDSIRSIALQQQLGLHQFGNELRQIMDIKIL